TGIGHVGDPILVVVELGATVAVLEAVLVLGLGGALVVEIRDAVAVGVGAARKARQARDVDAAVVDVQHTVLVVVGLGAAVAVLEAGLALGLVGAAIRGVEDAVAIAIELARLRRRRAGALEPEPQAHEAAPVRRAVALAQAGARAAEQLHAADD